jgi:Fe-S cluster assembly iron-binding protein IscA
MLTLTDAAATAVREIVDEELPGGGLRLVAHGHGDHVHLGMELAPAPEPTDMVVEHAGARVFVDAGLVDQLDGTTLNAVEEDGELVFDVVGWEEPH